MTKKNSFLSKVQRVFGKFAAVKNCRVMKDKNGVSRRFAFVEFFDLNVRFRFFFESFFQRYTEKILF